MMQTHGLLEITAPELAALATRNDGSEDLLTLAQRRTDRCAPEVELRLEAFNLLDRANFGVPELRAFAGTRDNEPVLATFGRITNTITSARQVQLGVRVRF
jgi:hypothetical protein